jgi:hypothetical protein
VVVYQPIEWKEIFIQSLINFILGYKLGFAILDFKTFQADPAAAVFFKAGKSLLWTWFRFVDHGLLVLQNDPADG